MLSLANMEPTQVRQVASSLAGTAIGLPVRVDGGANNQVYKITDDDGRQYALKYYINGINDMRDRLGAEYSALQFLSENGITSVPSPLAVDRGNNLALYEWIDGESILSVSDSDMAAAVDFLRTLHGLRSATGADELPFASETCLSPAELVRQIIHRLDVLEQVAESASRLDDLINNRIGPCLKHAISRAKMFCDAAHRNFADELEPAYRTFSPADFGFHNALRLADRRIIFFDFEYFGWDEPAKLTSEFVLHPGMSLSEEQKRCFIAETEQLFGADPNYKQRVRALFPLYALRWCLIVLNEFLPDRWSRRLMAGKTLDRELVLDRQLDKAYRLLAIAEASLDEFPYGD